MIISIFQELLELLVYCILYAPSSLRSFGKLFCVNISLFQMSFNGGAQKSDIFLNALLGYY